MASASFSLLSALRLPAGARGNVPSDIFCGVRALLNTLAACIAKRDALLALPQTVGLCNITDMT